ncbi:MAG TPA: purine-nucleoside phosphorylase, partial [Aggregatilineales bacterium]|nr:purine-nucleoside phosphorylase [Aggregatilineales bacterium]
KGRVHLYEGYSLEQVTFPIRVMHFLGVKTLILTNAAGGLNKSFNAGDIMMLNDHINMVGFVGLSPLAGKNDDDLGPRFVGLVQTYDRALRQLTHEIAKTNGVQLREGVYCCLGGPTYETPAEARMLRMIGGDAVGMSTAHEVVVARHMGIKVLAFSSITNMVIDNLDTEYETNHEEVLEVGRIIVPKLITLLKGVVERI